MEDIAPELIGSVRDYFYKELKRNANIKALYEKVRDGTATYTDAHNFSVQVGNLMAKAIKLNVSSDVLPDGRMYYNIAERFVNDLLTDEHTIVTDMAASVQEIFNKSVGLKSVKAKIPEIDQDRIDGLIERLSEELDFDSVAWLLDDPLVNFAMNAYTQVLMTNADMLTNLGVTQITLVRSLGRTKHDKHCPWCNDLAGVYNYSEVSNSGNDVFKRHDGCRCMVTINGKQMNTSGNAFVRG